MRPFFPVIFSTIVIAILSVVEISLLRSLHRDWWQRAWVRRVSWGIPAVGVASLLVWTLGVLGGMHLVVAVGATVTVIVFVLGLALMISLPLSGALHLSDRVLLRRQQRRAPETSVDPMRRRFLTTSAAVFPALAVTAGATGLVNGYLPPRNPVIPLYYPALPPHLEGLRILHITDVHVGLVIGLGDLEAMAEAASVLRPDLVLVTGDFSDEADQYLAALRLVASIPSTYGHYASMGNHEYYAGIDEVLRAYEKGPIPLLYDSGTTLRIAGGELFLAGVDDPRSMGSMPENYFRQRIDAALSEQPLDVFTILMSHRPKGFDEAAKSRIELTVAGHTHGGQIGFNGHSLLTVINPGNYMWGLFERGGSKLNVSAGAGHWFPYRIGCPAEIPLYVLTSRPVRNA